MKGERKGHDNCAVCEASHTFDICSRHIPLQHKLTNSPTPTDGSSNTAGSICEETEGDKEIDRR
eukprot:scaffold177771_cov33-Tisochrysis_lutea.AAC.1